MRSRRSATIALGLLVSCAETTRHGASDVELPPPGSADARDTPPRQADVPLSGWSPAGRAGPALAAPCPNEASAGMSQAVVVPGAPVCGTRARVSLEFAGRAMSPADPAPPCQPRSLPDAPENGFARGLCVVGDELVVSTRCYMCRLMDAGEVAHARLSELTPEQSAFLSRLIGASPPPDASGWRALAARAAEAPSPLPP